MGKILNILLIVLLGVSAVLFFMFSAGALDEGAFIVWGYILFIAAAAGSILFPLGFMAMNPKKAVRAIVGAAILGVIVLIAYALASDEIPQTLVKKAAIEGITPSVFKLSGMGIYTMYILGILAVVSIIFAEVSKIFK